MAIRLSILLLAWLGLSLPAEAAPQVRAAFDYRALHLEFAQPMQIWDNDAALDVRLEPALPLRCAWHSDTLLVCLPEGERVPAAATRYRIRLPSGLRTQEGEALPDFGLEAETARPTLQAWVEGWELGLPRIVVSSAQRLGTDEAVRVLRLERDGLPATLALRALPPRGAWDRGSRFDLELPEALPPDSRLALRIAPGLRWEQGPLPGQQDQVLVQALANERFRLRGVACGGRVPVEGTPREGRLALRCLAGEPVVLAFSARPDAASQALFADALPAAATLTGWEAGHRWHRGIAATEVARAPGYSAVVSIEADNRLVPFVLPSDMRSEAGRDRLEPVALHLAMGDRRPTLYAPHARRLLADGRRVPVLAEAVNAPPQEIGVEGVGARLRTATGAMPDRRSNTPAQPRSPETAQTLAEGGWVRWTPAGDGSDLPAQGVEFAAPDFDLYGLAGRREVLAWANHWSDGAPVAGAKVELLWRAAGAQTPQVVAQARTGADGVARLQLPEDFARAEEEGDDRAGAAAWWLRATHGRGRRAQRAVLPGGAVTRFGTPLGQAEETRHWGVADRPLYRAGDVVRYRLWQRRASRGRLLRIAAPRPLDLQLHDLDESKTISRWRAVPDAGGGLSGELSLPIHLTDGTYCIGAGDRGVEGACFFVGTYRSQDLWIEAKTEDRVLRDGENFSVDVLAGYYSGGPAAGIDLDRVSTLVTGLPLPVAYPQYREYEFVDVGRSARHGVELASARAVHATLDGDGHARLELPVAFAADAPEPPAFGELRLVAEARASDREAAASNPARARYARFARYVGLRVAPAWLDAATPVRMEGVVVDADGRTVGGAQVEVEVHYLRAEHTGRPPRLLARCKLSAGEEKACDFPRERSGRYRITARSGDAAATEVTRYVWTGRAEAAEAVQPSMEVLQAPRTPGAPLRILVRQPHQRAHALLAFEHGDALLDYRILELDQTTGQFSLETDPDWPADIGLSLHVRDRAGARVEGALRYAPQLALARLPLALPSRHGAAEPVALEFEAQSAAPGQRVRLSLRNDGEEARDVVLAVVDDGLRTLAGGLLARFDPHGEYWLGAQRHSSYSSLLPVSFGDWNQGAPWRYHLPWAPPPQDPGEGHDCIQVEDAARAACRSALAAIAASDGGDPHAPPAEPPVVFDEPSPMDAPAPPAPPAPLASSGTLDRIEVTGTRTRPGLDSPSEGGGRPPGQARPRGQTRDLETMAQVRTRFVDSAFWLPDLRLAPGEARSFEFDLPDNLTRWRAIAWSSDADDGFAMADATLEAGLPLEVRLQTPVRIYPGDRARLAANVRQSGDAGARAHARLQVEGAGAGHEHAQVVPLAARGQASFGSEIAPERPGVLRVTASARADALRDAVAASIVVASPRIAATRVQAGWLAEAPLSLELPRLPAGADRARLSVALRRGGAGLTERWTEDLRAFPHRCWEQILSRAVAAALALERGESASWPEAAAVVREALDNAAVFQSAEGEFRFFAESASFDEQPYEPGRQVALTAYTLRMFALLRELGHAVPPDIEEGARRFLEEEALIGEDAVGRNEQAIAAGALGSTDPESLGGLWEHWDELVLPARISLTEGLALSGHPAAAPAVERLLDAAPARGQARVVMATGDTGRWMGSRLREQCALISLLQAQPQLAGTAVRRALVAGLTDLYSGGIQAVDTQTGAYCLVALRGFSAGEEAGEPALSLRLGDAAATLRLAPGEDRADWQVDEPRGDRLELRAQVPGEMPASFVAELHYEEDARRAQASAAGLAIERRYAVLRAGTWRALDAAQVNEGDWVRVTLVVDNAATRHFVAVSDAVPGGLQPTDLALGAIAGLDLERVSDTGSWWFGTRRLDPRTPRFYAEVLPPGRHELHYFARAGNVGDYLAAPAVAELMYGNASHARSAAARLLIEPTTGAPR